MPKKSKKKNLHPRSSEEPTLDPQSREAFEIDALIELENLLKLGRRLSPPEQKKLAEVIRTKYLPAFLDY
jgi:hypothetical protein